MHSIDLFSVGTFVSGESPTGYEDSGSSEGVPTPLEGPQSHSNFLGHSGDFPLFIDIPKKMAPPLIGTPFITDSSSLFEYPFPSVSPRPPLSSASSASSITSNPGPPSSATQDKHSSHVLARLSSRGHRRAPSNGGLSPIPIPIPPRLRKLSAGHLFDESTPTQHDIPTPRFDLSPDIRARAELRDTIAARPTRVLQTRSYARVVPASTPRACLDVPIASRRRSMPAVLIDSDDDRSYASANEELPRLRL